MKDMKYLVSVIIPIYNAEKYIERCVRSLFEQTFSPIEYIFVNDCTQDRSLWILHEVMLQYPERISHVKIVNHSSNKGVSAARNSGLQIAAGEYIGWVDSDDWIEKIMFEYMYKSTRESQVEMVCCDYFINSPEEEIVDGQRIYEDKNLYLRDVVKGKIQGLLWNKIVKRSVFEQYQIRFIEGNNVGEDKNVCIKLLFFTDSLKFLSKALYHYNVCNLDSITRGDIQYVYGEINNAKDIIHFLKEMGCDKTFSKELISLKLSAKKKLLYSLQMENLIQWRRSFPESNMHIFGDKEVRLRHKILALLCLCQCRLLLRVWICVKRIR